MNLKNVQRLVSEKRMTPTGMAAFEARSEADEGVLVRARGRGAEPGAGAPVRSRVEVLRAAAAVVPQDEHSLGHQREEGGDPGEATRAIDCVLSSRGVGARVPVREERAEEVGGRGIRGR